MKNYVIFDAFKTNEEGAWYYAPDNGVFKEGEPSYGFGSIKYPEGSVYTGGIYYDGKNFIKHGFGEQDFTYSTMGRVNKTMGVKKYKFVGEYDKDHEWIFGNGVLYYVNDDLTPARFVKASFEGLVKTGEYKGEFDYSSLLQGFTPQMEREADEDLDGQLKVDRRQKEAETFGKAEVLFLGDSYFDFWDDEEYAGKNLFNTVFPKTFLNIGIGGSKFSDWNVWIDQFKNMTEPEKIIINLGYNDSHVGITAEEIYKNYLTFLGKVRCYFPSSKLYLIKAVHSPCFPNQKDIEKTFNEMTESTANELNVTMIDWNEEIQSSNESCFHPDKVHPNEHGYEILGKKLKKVFL